MIESNLTDKVTVFVISTQRDKNYRACLEALSCQTVRFKLIEIKDTYPMSKAYNKMLDLCDTPYFIQCDEDMILKPDAIYQMYKSIISTRDNIATDMHKLYDSHLEVDINGVRINKYDILKNYPFQNVLACENDQKIRLRNNKFLIKINNSVMGEHSPYWTNQAIFRRYYNFMERYKKWNSHKEIPHKIYETYKNNPTELNFYALLGTFISLFTSKIIDKEKNFLSYANKKFKKVHDIIQNQFKIKTELDFVSPDYKHPYILKLAKYLNIKLVDWQQAKNINKPLMIWNEYSYISHPRHIWKKEICEYFRNKNRPVYVVERGALPNTIFIDLNGFLCNSSSYDKSYWDSPLGEAE